MGIAEIAKNSVEKKAARDRIDLAERVSTEGREQLTLDLDLSNWDTITWGQLFVSLHAPDGIPFDENTGLPIDWRLENISVNGKTFNPSDTHNSNNIVHKAAGFKSLKAGLKNNRITITWTAPIGAGVVSPNAQISAHIMISGLKKIPLPLAETSSKLKNFPDELGQTVDNATLPAIIILAVIAVIAIAVAVSITRVTRF